MEHDQKSSSPPKPEVDKSKEDAPELVPTRRPQQEPPLDEKSLDDVVRKAPL